MGIADTNLPHLFLAQNRKYLNTMISRVFFKHFQNIRRIVNVFAKSTEYKGALNEELLETSYNELEIYQD